MRTNHLSIPYIDVDVVFPRKGVRELYSVAQPAFPDQGTPYSAGYDVRACMDEHSLLIGPGQRAMIPCGIAIQIKCAGWAAFLYSRSGLGAVRGLAVAQGVGVVDPDYTGEIMACMLNTSDKPVTLERGERIAQIVFQPYANARWKEVIKLDPTLRGSGGFGHTGLD